MKRLFSLLMALLFTASTFAGEEETILNTATGNIHGKLMLPECDTPCPVVLIIAGSGPTDMNGNSIGTRMTNNSLLYLAQELAANGIASVRYDKRGIGKSVAAGGKEGDFKFVSIGRRSIKYRCPHIQRIKHCFNAVYCCRNRVHNRIRKCPCSCRCRAFYAVHAAC